MAQQAKKAEFDGSAVGVFSYPGSHHVNSDYGLGPNAIGTSGPASRRDTSRTDERPPRASIRAILTFSPRRSADLPERWNGVQMTHGIPVPHPLYGTAMDLEVKRLGENDPYLDPGKHDRAAAHAAVKKRVSEKGFFPPKTSSDFLGPPFPHMSEGDEKDASGVGKERKEKLKKLPRRGIYTAPGKKGCSNTPGVTIGRLNYEPIEETYQPARALSRDANRAARARIEIPWGAGAAGNAVGRSFDPTMNALTYEPGAWAEKQKPRKKTDDPNAPKPFKPGGSRMRAPERFAYQSDPHDYEAERRMKNRADAKRAGRFMPPAGAKTTTVKSISKYDKGTFSAPTSLRETQLIK